MYVGCCAVLVGCSLTTKRLVLARRGPVVMQVRLSGEPNFGRRRSSTACVLVRLACFLDDCVCMVIDTAGYYMRVYLLGVSLAAHARRRLRLETDGVVSRPGLCLRR